MLPYHLLFKLGTKSKKEKKNRIQKMRKSKRKTKWGCRSLFQLNPGTPRKTLFSRETSGLWNYLRASEVKETGTWLILLRATGKKKPQDCKMKPKVKHSFLNIKHKVKEKFRDFRKLRSFYIFCILTQSFNIVNFI